LGEKTRIKPSNKCKETIENNFKTAKIKEGRRDEEVLEYILVIQ